MTWFLSTSPDIPYAKDTEHTGHYLEARHGFDGENLTPPFTAGSAQCPLWMIRVRGIGWEHNYPKWWR